MMFPFVTVSTLLLLSSLVKGDNAAMMCSSFPDVSTHTYHNDGVCNRLEFNSFKASLNRHLKHRKLQAMGGANLVPDQKTVICPLEGEAQDLSPAAGQVSMTGLDTIWIVENTSSKPVVVAYVNQNNGLEYSAVNSHIAPPQDDPNAILQPNEWKPIYTYEGHVFHVRELDADGNLGRIVVQHRAGLVPIGANVDPALLMDCPLEDVEPVKDPNFKRTPPKVNRPCNSVDIGFRNVAGCPIHGYYVSTKSDTCQENFKFHLGVNAASDDFMVAWQSNTKYESSYMGHTFAFRLASNPSVLVETVTLQPTKVIDCPRRKVQAGIAVGGQGIMAAVHRNLFQNTTEPSLVDYNATLPAMTTTSSGLLYASTAGLASL